MDIKSLLNLRSTVDSNPSRVAGSLNISTATTNSLRETKQWCLAQKLRATEVETPQVARARELLLRAAELSRSACNRATGNYDSNHPGAIECTLLFRLIDYKVLTSLTPQLRSPELQPPTPLHELGTLTAIEEAVQELARQRSGLLAERHLLQQERIDDLPGRLLLYEPQETVDDGAAQVSSQGFYDVRDSPPWDLWVTMQERSIVCWVPELLITHAPISVPGDRSAAKPTLPPFADCSGS